MDLVQSVSERLQVDREKSIKGLGVLFLAIRMAVDMKTFTTIASVFPESGQWMLETPFEDGGTGEMLAMATPGAVRRMLAIAGYSPEHTSELCEIVGGALQSVVSPDTYHTVAENLPLFE
ncbi:MAG: hypothetical protein OER90_10160 [Gemmatimonadota bacterium]|nr:hypothetical protein [Gemmatimonadota bacterium]